MGHEEQLKPMMRPEFGQAGQDIKLTTNFFRLKYNSQVTVHQYDIEIKPECPKYLRRRLIHQFSQSQKAELFKSKLITSALCSCSWLNFKAYNLNHIQFPNHIYRKYCIALIFC